MTEANVQPNGLPPMPNPATGLPRPPRAPVKEDWSPVRPPLEKAWLPKAPEGASPMLEWHAPARGGKVLMSSGASLIVGVFLTVYATLRTGGFEWATVWWLWAIVVGTWVGMYYVLGRDGRAAAGADWMAGNRGWVRTYELVEVRIRRSTSWDVLLRDARGGKTETPLMTLQVNRDLWDLVYNGIRHSVAKGAKTNQRARDWFELP